MTQSGMKHAAKPETQSALPPLLLIEDEPAVMALVHAVLEGHGPPAALHDVIPPVLVEGLLDRVAEVRRDQEGLRADEQRLLGDPRGPVG